MAGALELEDRALEAVIDTGAIVRGFPGPACAVDQRRRILVANSVWDAVINQGSSEESLPPEIVPSVLTAGHTGRPHRALVAIASAGGGVPFEVTSLPLRLAGESATLVLAADMSVVETLQGALIDSRDFHRDLALCSTDATFEIDSGGIFTYVGPCGFLGYADFELHGKSIRDFVVPRSEAIAENVLQSREAVWEAELWFRSIAGTEHCFLVSAMPVVRGDGEWAGLRGVGREVTGLRVREAEIARAKRSQRSVDAVLRAMCSEADPSVMIRAGAAAVIDTLGIDACFVVVGDEHRPRRVEFRCVAREGEKDGDPLMISDGAVMKLCEDAMSALLTGHYEREAGGVTAIATAARYNGEVKGALVFIRHCDQDGEPANLWSADDWHLLRVAADQIGVALAQVELFGGFARDDGAAGP